MFNVFTLYLYIHNVLKIAFSINIKDKISCQMKYNI